MKILFAANYTSKNPFIKESVDSLKRSCHVTCSMSDFLECNNNNYDIVQLQWPESYVQELKKESLKSTIIQLDKVLKFWSNESKLVITRHNHSPHKKWEDSFIKHRLYSNIYKMFYNYVDAVVHMGMYSKIEYMKGKNNQTVLHCVIPHGIYESYPNILSMIESRKILNIEDDDIVILSFGEIRNFKELKFCVKVFNGIQNHNKKMIITGLKYKSLEEKIILKSFVFKTFKRIIKFLIRKYSYKRLVKETVKEYNYLIIDKLVSKTDDRLILVNEFIPFEEVQIYFNASNIVFLPRAKALNSGVVPLALGFSKKIVGPAIGNIEELLFQTKNFTYKAKDRSDATNKIIKAIGTEDLTQPIKNNDMDWNTVSEKYIGLYQELIGKKYVI